MPFDVLLLVVGQLDKKQQQQQESVSSVSLQLLIWTKKDKEKMHFTITLWIQNCI